MAIKKDGTYYGIIRDFNIREFENKEKKTKFEMLAINIDVIENTETFLQNGKSTTSNKTYMTNVNNIKEYFNQCEKNTAESVGEKIKVVIKKEVFTSTTGDLVEYFKIKYFYFLDENDNIIKDERFKTKIYESKKIDF